MQKLCFRRTCLVLSCLTLTALASPEARAEGEAAEETSPTFTFTAHVDAVSKYVWRGLRANDDFSFQPSLAASAYGLTASVWGQLATKSPTDRTLEEVDLTLSYSRSLGKLSLGGGWIRYMYPGDLGGDPTNELFLTAAYGHSWAPLIGLYYDLDLKSLYLEANAGPTFELAPKLALTPNVTASFYDFDEGDSATRVEPAAVLGYELGGGLKATAKLAYVLALSPDAAKNTFWAGAGLNYSF